MPCVGRWYELQHLTRDLRIIIIINNRECLYEISHCMNLRKPKINTVVVGCNYRLCNIHFPLMLARDLHTHTHTHLCVQA